MKALQRWLYHLLILAAISTLRMAARVTPRQTRANATRSIARVVALLLPSPSVGSEGQAAPCLAGQA